MSVIIPARPEAPLPQALSAFRGKGDIEILISRGTAPSAQRNEACLLSKGSYLLFLDDDSLAPRDLPAHYLAVFEAEQEAGAVGGPACLAGDGLWARVCSAMLSEKLVVGKSASRYRPRGAVRECDERELILCNLAVRRRAFVEAGGFDPALYPNEENDFLMRLKQLGWKLLYDPTAQVRRPAWPSVAAFLKAIARYGCGRGTLARKGLSKPTCLRVGAALLALGLGAVASVGAASGFVGLWLLPLSVYLAYLLLVCFAISLRCRLHLGLACVPVVPLVHLSYAAGLVFGLLRPRLCRPGAVAVTKLGGGQ